MYPANFVYERPETLEEALELLAEHRNGTKIIAGGATLVPLMKLRLATPERLIDIGGLRDLAGESQRDGHLVFWRWTAAYAAQAREANGRSRLATCSWMPILRRSNRTSY